MLGTPLHLLGRGLPDGRRPVGLLSREYPEGGLREVAGDAVKLHERRRRRRRRPVRLDERFTLALTDLVIDLADVLGLPSGVVAVADNDIGSLEAPWLRSGVLREKPT